MYLELKKGDRIKIDITGIKKNRVPVWATVDEMFGEWVRLEHTWTELLGCKPKKVVTHISRVTKKLQATHNDKG